MAVETKASLTTDAAAFFFDNNVGAITPASLRTYVINVVASYLDGQLPPSSTATANFALLGPSSGAPAVPSMRAMVNADLPAFGAAGFKGATAAGAVADLTVAQAQAILGVLFGGVTSKTSNYNVLSTDDGTTFALGGNAFFTLTFPAPGGAGFSGSSFVVVNTDTGRGKTIAINGLDNFILWPGQIIVVWNNAGTSWLTDGPKRWVIPKTTAFINMFVDPTNGSDANDGLSTGANGAVLTLQRPYDIIATQWDPGQACANSASFQIIINTKVGAGPTAYTAGVTFAVPATWVFPLCITYLGDSATPSNVTVTINDANNACFQMLNGPKSVVVRIVGFTISNTNATGDGIKADGGTLQISNIAFGKCGNAMSYSKHQGYTQWIGPITTTTNASGNYLCVAQSEGLAITEFQSVTFGSGTVFNIATFLADAASIYAGQMTFNNTANMVANTAWVKSNSGEIIQNPNDPVIPGNNIAGPFDGQTMGGMALVTLGSGAVGTPIPQFISIIAPQPNPNTNSSVLGGAGTGTMRYRIPRIIITQASGDISTSTFGIFAQATGSSAGVNVIVSGATTFTITTGTVNANNNMMVITPVNTSTQSWSVNKLFFQVFTSLTGQSARVYVETEFLP